jgi:hypothetical protein
MPINLTNEQYRDLIIMFAMANGVLGILGDSLPDDYKERSLKMGKLEEYLLQHADDFGCSDLVEKNEGKNVFKEKIYIQQVMGVLDEYDECNFFDELANKLAWRDFHKDHTKAEIADMSKSNGGYFGVALYEYEKKYWDEFEKYDVGRLGVKE